jgi:chlorosome envelope protein H
LLAEIVSSVERENNQATPHTNNHIMAEELKQTSDKPETATKKAPESSASQSTGSADFPTLFGNIGLMIDSSIGSVTEMIHSANSLTKQVSENITLTTNSDAVKGMVDNIGSLSQNVIKGVNDTLNSEQLKKTFDELGKLASTVIDGAGSVARSEQTQNLFNTISTGLNQLLHTIVSPIQSGAAGIQSKKAVEIPFCHKAPYEEAQEAAVPEKQDIQAIQEPKQEKKPEAGKPAQATMEPSKPEKQENKEERSVETKKIDPSRKGTVPRQNPKN